MQWGQIKTLFILCFLILDIFLLHQIINNPNVEYESTEEFTREENLRINVGGLDQIPEETPAEESMLYAQRKEFTEDDREEIEQLPDQKSIIIDEHLLISQFDTPLEITENTVDQNSDLESHIWNIEDYQYFGKDEETNTLIFFQEIDRPIYFNLSGVLLIQLNEEEEAVRYVQTILEKADEQPAPEEINKPLEAVSVLYFNDGLIMSGDEITDEVSLGYHNLLPLPNGVQVLAPTWEVTVNEENFYYVNAIESHYTTREMGSFVGEMKTQIEEHFADSSAVIEQMDEEAWEDEEIQTLLDQLFITIQQQDGVE